VRVVFLARQALPFSPAEFDRQAVGGSELALYRVAKGLAELGHEVIVVNRCVDEAGVYGGVWYFDLTRDATTWQQHVRSKPADVLVLFRRMLDVTARIPARSRVFWAHDHQGVQLSDPPSLGRRLAIAWRRFSGPWFHERVDRVFVVSEFMAELFIWLFRTPKSKLVVMPNGVDAEEFEAVQVRKRPHQFVYTSVPERGLDELLRAIFPKIRRAYPDAILQVTSYRSLESYRGAEGEGVVLRGTLARRDLARLLMESAVMLYPSRFEEMGAIAVLESMAAGTPAVTSTRGVLRELAGGGERGVAVEGTPGTKEFAERFVEATLELLADEDRLARMRKAAREYVLENHEWRRIVRRWDEVLASLS
jgi:glycosyltransferase involved in cell wall biosynthesis